MKTVGRVALFLLALLAVAAIFFGGGYLVLRQIASGPKFDFGSIQIPEGSGGIEKQLIGLYLQWKQTDVETPASDDGQTVTFVVEAGEGASDVGTRLQEAGLIRDASLFGWVVRYYDLGSRLQAGEYELAPDMTMLEILERLQHGRLQETTITIPEGWRLEEVAAYLEEQGIASREEFISLATSESFDYAFLASRPLGASLEGYLFPDTYRIAATADAQEVIVRMLDNFDARFTPEMRARAEEVGLTIHQVVSLAAIVEREAVLADERPLIAAVYLNRLDQGMYLDADPTIQYAIGFQEETGKWWNRLSAEDYQSVDSPYNSYTNLGLPPGPICSPGLDSIQAVLYPAQTDYLYFLRNDVAGDGSHVFARTFEEHLANQEKYRR